MGDIGLIAGFIVSSFLFAWLARRLLGARGVSWAMATAAGAIGCGAGGIAWWAMLAVDVDDDGSALGVGVITAVLVTMGVIVALQLLGTRPAARSPRLGPRGSMRVARRATEVASIAARHGLGPYVGRRTRQTADPLPSRIRDALEESGVVFVKFGQVLAGRPDLVGQSLATELSELQHRVTPLDRSVMEPVLRREIASDRVSSISWDPLGSASIAQVYAAELDDGTDVVVKIRRPDVVDDVRRDSYVLRHLAHLVERHHEPARSIGLADLVEGFVDDLERELDYDSEARASADVQRGFIGTPIRVPTVHTELSSASVLVVDRVDGVPLAGADLERLSADDRRELAVSLVGAHVGSMLAGDRFHADLHPGNVMLTEDDGLALIDFGATGMLGSSEQGALASLLLGLRMREPALLRDSLIEVSISDGAVDTARLDRALAHLLSEHIRPSENLDSAAVAGLMRVVRDHGLRLPASSSAMFRGLVTVLDSVETLSPGLVVLDHIEEIGEVASAVPSSPQDLAELVRDEAVQLLPVLRRAPRLTDSVATQLDRGDLSFRVRALSHPDDIRVLTRLVNRGVMAFIAVGLGIVSAMLFGLSKGPFISSDLSVYDVLGSIGLLTGAVLIMRVVLQLLEDDTR